MILLASEKIKSILTHLNFKISYELYCLSTIDSTNRFLNDLPPNQLVRYCCAEEQTAGRGRFGRQWNSPFGENIYFSGRWVLSEKLNKLSGLSLIVGLAVVDCLKKQGVNEKISVKWPNDLYWKTKKLGGILIELNTKNQGKSDLTIGIGLNVNTGSTSRNLSDKPWCSLLDITGDTFDRNELIADLIITLNCYLEDFLRTGFETFKPLWENVDYLKDKWVTVSQPKGKLSGYARGVNADGHLRLQDSTGTLHDVSAGEASLS